MLKICNTSNKGEEMNQSWCGLTPSLILPAHIEHIRNISGVDHVGIGADYEGGGRWAFNAQMTFPKIRDFLHHLWWLEECALAVHYYLVGGESVYHMPAISRLDVSLTLLYWQHARGSRGRVQVSKSVSGVSWERLVRGRPGQTGWKQPYQSLQTSWRGGVKHH